VLASFLQDGLPPWLYVTILVSIFVVGFIVTIIGCAANMWEMRERAEKVKRLREELREGVIAALKKEAALEKEENEGIHRG